MIKSRQLLLYRTLVISMRKFITDPLFCTIPENSPAYEHQSNGGAERGAQEVKGMVRTLKHHLEQSLGFKLNFEHPIISWLIEHASTLITRYLVGSDGNAAYERAKGRT